MSEGDRSSVYGVRLTDQAVLIATGTSWTTEDFKRATDELSLNENDEYHWDYGTTVTHDGSIIEVWTIRL